MSCNSCKPSFSYKNQSRQDSQTTTTGNIIDKLYKDNKPLGWNLRESNGVSNKPQSVTYKTDMNKQQKRIDFAVYTNDRYRPG